MAQSGDVCAHAKVAKASGKEADVPSLLEAQISLFATPWAGTTLR